MYSGYKEIILEKQDKILVIKFNNPRKKNSLNRSAYTEIGRALRAVANDDTVSIVVLTGTGDYFSSGNDLTQSPQNDDFESYKKESGRIFKEMVRALIDCPKVTIALVNGPAIGIGATYAALCDMMWCSENAYFYTPFTKLGLVPEACASYIFPLLLGRSKATEMLLFGEKLTAAEAYRYNFVSKVFKLSELNSVIWPKIKEYSQLPPCSLAASKELLRSYEKETLHKILVIEVDELYKRIGSEEFIEAILSFSMRKEKSKL